MTRGNVLAALVVSALVGCSDPKAGTLPSTTPTPTFSASTTASASSTRVPDAAYAEAIERFYDVLERGSRDPAVGADQVERLIDERCPCRQIINFLREQARLGRRIERPVAVANIRVARRNTTEAAVFLTLRQSAGQVLDRDGHVVEELRATTDKLVVEMTVVSGQFLVRQIATDRS